MSVGVKSKDIKKAERLAKKRKYDSAMSTNYFKTSFKIQQQKLN